jgi:cyclic pyranopterin monophosphate synthase
VTAEDPRLLPVEGDPGLTHIDGAGRARMVDVSAKPWTRRRAVARGHLVVDLPALFPSVPGGAEASPEPEITDIAAIFEAARDAGIDAARKTAQLIPLCHPLPTSDLDVRFDVRPGGVTVEATAEVVAPTGVEMEALTACIFSGLALVRLFGPTQALLLDDVVLWEKEGGRSGHWLRGESLSIQ